MATHSLLLLPGDGIGPEVMAEVERLVAFFSKKSKAEFKTRDGAVSAAPPSTSTACRSTDETLAKAARRRCHRVRLGRRPQVGQGRLREPARGRPAEAAQGARPVRQPAARHLLSGAGRSLHAEARARRRPRHPDPARADRRHLFRRAQGDRDAGGRPEARRRHHRLHHAARSSASRASPSISPASAEQGALGREAQRHEDGRALERGRHRGAQEGRPRTSSCITSWPMPAPCSSCATPSSSTSSFATTCSATCCPTRPPC